MSEPRPDLSVLMTVHNRNTWLREAVESVLAQTYAGSLEIVLVDDGSEGDPAEVVRGIDPRLRILRKQNGGLGSARQHGFEHSRGRYIASLDDDDLFVPRAMEWMVGLLERHADLGMVFGDIQPFTPGGDTGSTIYRRYPQIWEAEPAPERIEADPPAWRFGQGSLLRPFAVGKPLFFQSVVYRRDFLERIGGWRPRIVCYGENIDGAWRATWGGPVGFLDAVVFRLRRGHGDYATRDEGRALSEELRVIRAEFAAYPEPMQAALRGPLAEFCARQGWLLTHHGMHGDAAAAYAGARRLGHRPLRMAVKQALAALRTRQGSQP